MTPFQEFRLWLRRSPRGERAAAALATALVLSALGWVVVPSASTPTTAGHFAPSSPAEEQSGAAAAEPIPTSSTGAIGTATTSASGQSGSVVVRGPNSRTSTSVESGGTQATAPARSAPGSDCAAASNSVKGITQTSVKIGVALIDLAGPAANSLFGIDDPKVYQRQYNAVIQSINAAGGVACRKIVAKYYKANPADRSQMQATCLDMAADGMFAVIDLGAYGALPSTIPCFPQHGMLYFGAYSLIEQMRRQFYPYLYAFDTFDNLYANTVNGLHQRGFFDPAHGFRKLGIFYRNCTPQLMQQELRLLHQVGLQDAQIDTYNFGCPQAFASPSDIQQAVLQFRRDGVTNVTYVDGLGDFANFTKMAQQQGFKPWYGLPNDNIISTAYGNLRPDSRNIDGALAITDSRDAEDRTAGMTPTPGTARCIKILRPVSPSHPSQFPNRDYPTSGNPCDVMWLFQAAMNHAPAVSPEGLEAGLRAAGSVDFAFPQGPTRFNTTGVTTGGQYWRTTKFFLSCECWRLAERRFHPSVR